MNRDHSESNRRLRHIGYRALPWVWLLMIPLEWIPGDQHSFLHRLTGLIRIILLLSTTVASLWHQRDLCERCMAHVPLDGQKKAEKALWRLKFVHRGWTVYAAVVIAVLVLGVVFDPSGTAARIAWSCIDMFYMIANLNSMRHDRLTFWCPWCKDGGDGDEEEVPDPTDDKNRPVPA